MILQGVKKKTLKDIVAYYMDATGNTYDAFVKDCLEYQCGQLDTTVYSKWLANECITLLNERGITISDCVENKDVLQTIKANTKSRTEGEFYTPEIWCVDGREYLKNMLGDQWGKIAVWDASCYSMDTEVFTKRGWLTYDKLQDDDLVYSLNPDTQMGEWVGFHKRFEKKLKKANMVRFKGPHIDLLVTDNHKMYTTDKKVPCFDSATNLYDTLKGGNKRVFYNFARVSEINNTDNPVFWKMLGWFIGIEASRFEMDGRKSKLYIPTNGVHTIEILKLLAEAKGTVGKVKRVNNDYIIDYPELVSFIEKYELLKYNMRDISQFEIKNTEAFFDGYMLSTVSKTNKTCKLFTVCSSSATVLEVIATELGYKATTRREFKNGKISTVIKAGNAFKNNANWDNEVIEMKNISVWDITLDKNHVFLVKRNDKPVFCGNCGTGNLMRTAGYPSDKLFLSTLLEEDVQLVKTQFPDATVFKCDFLSDIDYDSDNMNFSNKLPENLRKVLENDEPIVFYMNPPYRMGCGFDTDVGSLMHSRNIGKGATDVLYQFIYRVMLIKETYKLSKVYMGLFGGVTLFHSPMLQPMYSALSADFRLVDGMCFQAGDFTNTSKTVPWVISYTTWESREPGEVGTVEPAKLVVKAIDRDTNTLVNIGQRTFKVVDNPMLGWMKATDVIQYTVGPIFTAHNATKNVLGKHGSNAFGQIMMDNSAIGGTRRCSIQNCSAPEGFDITESNLYACMASFAVRICYKRILNPYDNSQYFSAPNEKEGYLKWLHNTMALWLFDWSNYMQGYRNLEDSGEVWNLSNHFFPLSAEEVKQLTTDEVILKDMEMFPNDNSFILKCIAECEPDFIPEVREFYDFGMRKLCESLSSDRRKQVGYANSTMAWDASLMQVRRAPGYWTDEEEKEYCRLLNQAKTALQYGIYEFGFLEHYAGNYLDIVESNITEQELERIEEAEKEGV